MSANGPPGALHSARVLIIGLIAQNAIIIERFIRGSPLPAPSVFSNWGLIGLIVLLDPRERA